MFEKADFNHDGRVDFNEFLAMRRRTQRWLMQHPDAAPDGSQSQHAPGHHPPHPRASMGRPGRDHPSAARRDRRAKRKGKGSSGRRTQQAARGDPHPGDTESLESGGGRGGGGDEGSEGVVEAEVGSWVLAVRERQREGEARQQEARERHERVIAARFAETDALADLSDDELIVFESERERAMRQTTLIEGRALRRRGTAASNRAVEGALPVPPCTHRLPSPCTHRLPSPCTHRLPSPRARPPGRPACKAISLTRRGHPLAQSSQNSRPSPPTHAPRASTCSGCAWASSSMPTRSLRWSRRCHPRAPPPPATPPTRARSSSPPSARGSARRLSLCERATLQPLMRAWAMKAGTVRKVHTSHNGTGSLVWLAG